MTPLHRAVEDYLALRRQLGVTLHEAGRVLTAFAGYAAQAHAEYVTTALVLRWAAQLTHVSAATINGRFQMIRRFAEWRQLTDPRTEVPPADLLPGGYRRRPPRLYREDDIPRLLNAARQLLSAKGLRGHTYETLFGLLAVTGIRSSEVVALDDGDLDHRQGTLFVRRTKFGKSRLVPVHASTMEALAVSEPSGIGSSGNASMMRSLSPNAAYGSRSTLPSTHSRACRPKSACDRDFAPIAWVAAFLASTICGIASRSAPSWMAIVVVARSIPSCQCSRRIWATCMSMTRTYQAVPELLQLATERLTDAGKTGAP